jgi:hypothetical protein
MRDHQHYRWIGFYMLHSQLSRWLDEPDMKSYSLLFIISLFGAGCHQILNLWSIRKEYFNQLSRTKYMQSISQVSSQLLLSFIDRGPLGLIIGELLGRDEFTLSITKTYYNPTNNVLKYTLLPPKTVTSERKIELDQLSLPNWTSTWLNKMK